MVTRLPCYTEQESILFELLMNEIVTLPVTTVCHISQSVLQPLFAQVLAKELGHATLDGLWGFAHAPESCSMMSSMWRKENETCSESRTNFMP